MSAELDLASIDFGHLLRDVEKGLVVKPILANYLEEARFPEFHVKFRKGNQQRTPDGWFHPSEHPTYPERALFYYLQASANPLLPWVPERLKWMSRMSVTMGSAMHSFVEMCLLDAAYLLRPGECPICLRVCGEWGVINEHTRSRGHTDGRSKGENFEFKTSSNSNLSRIEDMDLEAFKAKWPVYYGQQQDYMRMSGLRSTRVLFVGLGNPWVMREFVLPYDQLYALRVADKYRRAIEAYEHDQPPMACCGARGSSKECPSRVMCGVIG